MIRIPKLFYRYYLQRNMPAPVVLKETSRNYWIDPNSEHLPQLLADAYLHATRIHSIGGERGPHKKYWAGSMGLPARRLAKAIRVHQARMAVTRFQEGAA
jgi:hypothetical protein